MLVAGIISVVSCTSDLDNTAVTIEGKNIRFVVGDFPAFAESSTRAVGTEDPGKTEWELGDEILLEMNSKTLGSKYATFAYNGNNWDLTSGELAYKENEVPTFPHVYYAPEYKWDSGRLVLKDDWVSEGKDEYIEGKAQNTPNGEAIEVSFSKAKREYSRLRIATIPDANIRVEMQGFTPVGRINPLVGGSIRTIHSDAKGNAYLYGSFAKKATVSVKYGGETVLAGYTFGEASKSGTSYVLDATVVSLEGMSSEEMDAAIEKMASEVNAGKTRLNLRLDAEPDEQVFDKIHFGLEEAGYCSIDLTLMGCEKIPARAFLMWKMLKSVTLPDVTEICESAFAGCSWLQKVVFGTSLTKVYGNPSETPGVGVFEGVETSVHTDLVLSGKQNQMSFSQIEWEDVWTADDGQPYKGSSEHMKRQFLGYTFKSVTCGN